MIIKGKMMPHNFDTFSFFLGMLVASVPFSVVTFYSAKCYEEELKELREVYQNLEKMYFKGDEKK